MERVATFAILGDSAASGVGDSDANGVTKGWGYYLAKHFQDPLVYINLSRPGAQWSQLLQGLRCVCPELRSRAVRHGAAGGHGRRSAGDRYGLRRCAGGGW